MKTVLELFFERGQKTAQEAALEVDGRIISYGELLEKAMLVASWARSKMVQIKKR